MKRRDFIKNSVIGACGVVLLSATKAEACFKPSINKMNKLLQNHALVVYKDFDTTFYDGKGIKPLMDYLKKDDFKGAYVADRRVGKASALLLAYGNVKEVYTPVISKPAIEVFKKQKIKYFAVKIVDNIMNHTLTDICPMEKKVQKIDNPQEAYELFKTL